LTIQGIGVYSPAHRYGQQCADFGPNRSSAQGIEVEIPEELWSNSEELERKARFCVPGTQKGAQPGLKKVNADALALRRGWLIHTGVIS
jgi:hypothetical protein